MEGRSVLHRTGLAGAVDGPMHWPWLYTGQDFHLMLGLRAILLGSPLWRLQEGALPTF